MRFKRSEVPRLLAVSALLVALTYGLLFWGIQFINSGSAALLELSFTPVALLAFALALRQEAFDPVRAAVIVLGLAGLAILFGPKVMFGGNPWEAWGAVATVSAAVAYAWGSVLAGPMIEQRGPWVIAASTMLLGGAMLVGVSFTVEPRAMEALQGHWGAAAWAEWGFLVVFGSLCAFTIYLRLLLCWGASKASSYAFVSPIIAVLAGMTIYGERVSGRDAVGMAVMLAAAVLALRTEPRMPVEAGSSQNDLGPDRAGSTAEPNLA